MQLFRNTTDEWYHVHVNGEEIVCTGGHPFYVLNALLDRSVVKYEGEPESAKGVWICANELQIGDKVLLSDGNFVTIKAVEVEKLDALQTTYNFEVAYFHSYYVSDSKILVHNVCVAKEGSYEARVNTSNEHGLPHAHILKDGKRMAKIDKKGQISGGNLDKGAKRFVNKFFDEINEGIKKYYPKK